MRYLALASDYDGTIAQDGIVDSDTVSALRSFRDSGRTLILVTGRELDELRGIFEHLDLFTMVVAENGAVLWNCKTHEEKLLGPPPRQAFVEELRRRGIHPVYVGKVIVATWKPHETEVFSVIRDLGLEMQVILNKGAVMVLPPGINKKAGLLAALQILGLSHHNVVGVGDAENDFSLLEACEVGAAVGNAVQPLKDNADMVLGGSHGSSVAELIQRIVKNDLSDLELKSEKSGLPIGQNVDGSTFYAPAYGHNILITGTSGGGKSTLAKVFIESLDKSGYQYCVIDPEGDYSELANATILGNPDRVPDNVEVLTALKKADANCVVNLIGQKLEDRARYFDALFKELLKLRSRTGRPHWVIVDETHHIFPSKRETSVSFSEPSAPNLLFITVVPEHCNRAVLSNADLVLVIGHDPQETVSNLAKVVGIKTPELPKKDPLEKGEVMAWWKTRPFTPQLFRSYLPNAPLNRHIRKYAEGDLEKLSFIFRGRTGAFNLKAQNLFLFLQIGEGLDEDTWLFHLSRGDYEKWFRHVINDAELADAIAAIAQNPACTAASSRAAIRNEIMTRYTTPA